MEWNFDEQITFRSKFQSLLQNTLHFFNDENSADVFCFFYIKYWPHAKKIIALIHFAFLRCEYVLVCFKPRGITTSKIISSVTAHSLYNVKCIIKHD